MNESVLLKRILIVVLVLIGIWAITAINWLGLLSLIFYPLGSEVVSMPFLSVGLCAILGLILYSYVQDYQLQNAIAWIFGVVIGIKLLYWLFSSFLGILHPMEIVISGAVAGYMLYEFSEEEVWKRIVFPLLTFILLLLALNYSGIFSNGTSHSHSPFFKKEKTHKNKG